MDADGQMLTGATVVQLPSLWIELVGPTLP